jgi:hypothetical protein
MFVLSTLFALGVGIAGAPAASAAPINGLSSAAMANPLVQEAQYYYPPRRYRRYSRRHCRSIRVCRYSRYYHRRICRIERVCRSRW